MLEAAYFLYYLTLTEKYENPANWSEETTRILEDHGTFLTNLGQEGKLIFAGRTDYDPGHKNLFGVALIKAESLESAIKMMASDPAVIHNIQKSEIYPYRLAIEFFEATK